jgi:hypothetical protein
MRFFWKDAHVRFGSKAVIRSRSTQCPLCAKSGHSAQSIMFFHGLASRRIW